MPAFVGLSKNMHLVSRGSYIGITTSGGGGESSVEDHTLRLSHLAVGKPFVVLLAPADADTDAARRLHLHTFSDPAA